MCDVGAATQQHVCYRTSIYLLSREKSPFRTTAAINRLTFRDQNNNNSQSPTLIHVLCAPQRHPVLIQQNYNLNLTPVFGFYRYFTVSHLLGYLVFFIILKLYIQGPQNNLCLLDVYRAQNNVYVYCNKLNKPNRLSKMLSKKNKPHLFFQGLWQRQRFHICLPAPLLPLHPSETNIEQKVKV